MKREGSSEERNGQWTRREVLRGAAVVAALSPMQGALAAAELLKRPTFAYVAAHGTGEDGYIHAFAVANGKWATVQRAPSRAPSCLALSRDQRVLYVANDIAEDAGLPRGTVEAFSIASNGLLTSLGARPLALSGANPRAMAVSPDGKLLVVAAYEGGLYSLFPIKADGRLSVAKHSYKPTGSGPHARMQRSSHPRSVVFDEDSGRLLTSDFGADRLSVFFIEGQKLTQQAQRHTGAGSGPGALVLHRASATMIAAHELEGALVSYRYSHIDETPLQVGQRVAGSKPDANAPARASLALHVSGGMLYSAWAHEASITAWRIDARTGQLSRPQELRLGSEQVVAAPDGKSILVVDRGSIHCVTTDATDGEMHAAEKVAHVENAKFVALKTN